MTLGLRNRMLTVAGLPHVVLAVVAASGSPGWLVATLAALSAGATVLTVSALLSPFGRLQSDAARAAQDAGLPTPSASGDGTEAVGETVAALGAELASCRATLDARDWQLRGTLTGTTEALKAVAKSWRAPEGSQRPDSPWAADNEALTDAVTLVAAAGAAAQRRAAGLQAVLNDLPDPVVVLDAKSVAIYVNAAAENWFSHLPGRGLKQPLASLLAEGGASDPANLDGPPAARPQDTIAWLKEGRGGAFEAFSDTADGALPTMFGTVPARARKANPWVVLTARDLTATKTADANLRHLHRRITAQRMSLLVAHEAGPALEAIRTQAGLLAQAAKQAGQRERFVPKVQRILEEVGRQKIVVDQLGWLGRLSTTTATEPEAEEVRVRSVADDVAAKLTPAFAERGNTIDLAGDAGWLIADEERIATVVAGLLLHANQSCESSAVAVTLRRRSAVALSDEVGEVAVQYAGPPITPAHVADIRDPFRRPNSGVTDATGKAGFLLGLAVSHKVAALMGGSLEIDGSDGVVCLRVIVPSRGRTDNRIAAGPVAFVPGADAEDAMSDFSLGGATSPTADSDTPPPVAVTSGGPPDLASDDSIGSFFGPG